MTTQSGGTVHHVLNLGLRGEVREYGRIANTSTALDRLLRKLGGDGVQLRFCYEDGFIPARRYRFR
jgi:hypothetical protein